MVSKKVLPLGEDDFRIIREQGYYYVDKTMLVKDFITSGNKVMLITRPRRFGKTLNMTMLRDFFDITLNSRLNFQGLAIMETRYAPQINSLPVIYLSLKECRGEKLNDLKSAVAEVVRKEYLRYKPILADVNRKDKEYSQYFKTLEMLEGDKLKDSLLKQSLFYLVQALHTRFGERPILIIDCYDNLVIETKEKVREKFTSFYELFLTSVLKENPHLGQAILTGIQYVARERIFSKLNNIVVYTVLDDRYAPHFGLTKEQTAQLLMYYGLVLNDDVEAFYNGYLFSDVEIYNPWSIFNYAHFRQLGSYWTKTPSSELVHEFIDKAEDKFHEEFEELIENEEVTVKANLEESFIEYPGCETLWGLLVNEGYLTAISEDYELEILTVKIPNHEMRNEFCMIVDKYTELSRDIFQSMRSAIIEGNIDGFFKTCEKLVLESLHHQNSKENAYYMVVLGMIMYLRDLYDITSTVESGRSNNIIMKSTDTDQRPNIIIELKQGKNIEKLKEKALKRAEEKISYIELSGNVLCVGFAHNKNEFETAHELITDFVSMNKRPTQMP